VLRSIGEVHRLQGDYSAARAAYDDALALYRAESDRIGEANCLTGLGHVERDLGRTDEALGAYARADGLYRNMGVVLGQANVARGRGDLYLAGADLDAARSAYGEALDDYASAGNERGQAYALWGLGRVAARTPGAEGAARGYLSRAREMFEALGLADEATGAARDLVGVAGPAPGRTL
jgi:tetratricopeptide (TPR) repeat protein